MSDKNDKNANDPNHVESDSIEYFPDKFFKYDKIVPNATKVGIMRKKGNKGRKSWNPRYFVLYYNYLIYYKLGKGKNGEPEKDAVAKGVFPLELITDKFKIEQITDKTAGNTGAVFVIPLQDGNDAVLHVERIEIMQEWIKAIRNFLDASENAKRLSAAEVSKRIRECLNIFPENMKLPTMVPPEQSEKWFNDTKKYKEEYKKWGPFIHSLNLYAEFQIGRVKGYSSWFTNKTKGVHEQLYRSEEDVLSNWEKEIAKFPDEIQDALDTMFYLEDLTMLIRKCDGLVTMIDYYNRAKKEFQLDDKERYREEQQYFAGWAEKFKGYPSLKSVTLDMYTNGRLLHKEEDWSWDQQNLVFKRGKYVPSEIEYEPEVVEWSAFGHPSQIVNQLYGVVLWTTKSWVWTHPRCPYIIRYDWFESKKVFKQYFSPNTEVEGKKSPLKGAPLLSDWQIAGNRMVAVTVGNREPPTEMPPITEWFIDGSIPPPVALLAATFYKIRPIMRQLLGIQSLVPTGLAPVF